MGFSRPLGEGPGKRTRSASIDGAACSAASSALEGASDANLDEPIPLSGFFQNEPIASTTKGALPRFLLGFIDDGQELRGCTHRGSLLRACYITTPSCPTPL